MGTVTNQATTWLDSYNPQTAANSLGAVVNTAGTPAAAKTYASTGSTLNIYGSGSDLQNAMSKYNGVKGVNFVDTSSQSFNPTSMSNGVMLGGTGVNKNVTDTNLNNSGVQRVWGQDSTGTAAALDNYMKTYGQPTAPTIPTTTAFNLDTSKAPTAMAQAAIPTYQAFNFTGSLQDYLDQAQNLLKPQLQQAENNINTQYDQSLIPQANNDTLKRGIARSTYAGNRIDTLNTARARDIQNTELSNQQQANNMGLQNYNTAYDRAYQGWNDQNNYNWNAYNAQQTQNKDNYQNAWNQYVTDLQNQKDTYNINNENQWKTYDAAQNQYNSDLSNYWNNKNWDQKQAEWAWQQIKDKNEESWRNKNYDNNNNQWQQQFNYQKDKDQKAYDLQLQQLALSQTKAASSGSRSGSSRSSSAASKAAQTDIDNAAFRNFQAQKTPQDQYALLHNQDFVNSVSPSMYKSLQSQYQSNLKNSGMSQSAVSSSQPTYDYSNSDQYIYSGSR